MVSERCNGEAARVPKILERNGMKGIGRVTKCMDTAACAIQVELSIPASGRKDASTDVENMCGLMEPDIQESG